VSNTCGRRSRFAKSVSIELAAQNITVNNVARLHATERLWTWRAQIEGVGKTVEDIYAEWERVIPARRLGRPEDLPRWWGFSPPSVRASSPAPRCRLTRSVMSLL